MEGFGERVKAEQSRLHMTDDDLAREAHISKRALQNYRRDPSNMTMSTLEALCSIFGCKAEYLIEGTNTKEMYETAVRLVRDALR